MGQPGGYRILDSIRPYPLRSIGRGAPTGKMRNLFCALFFLLLHLPFNFRIQRVIVGRHLMLGFFFLHPFLFPFFFFVIESVFLESKRDAIAICGFGIPISST